ncbi:hypothetical protein TNCV_4653781 [Trichonephila clavipes]|nr:hypothetical protein TNCV_4653781 [Trichonephila clavipes]
MVWVSVIALLVIVTNSRQVYRDFEPSATKVRQNRGAGTQQICRGSMSFHCHGSTCRNCGGGDRGRVAIYRPFGEFRRAKIVLSPVWCSRSTTDVPLAHVTMNFVGLDLTTSD